MTEGLPLCELEIDFEFGGSSKLDALVVWNEDQKILTRVQKFNEEDLDLFEDYKGKDLRVKLNGKQMTLSVLKEVPTYNDEGCFQIAYSECKEGWFAKEVFFEVQGLNEWVYYDHRLDFCADVSRDFGNRSEAFSEWLTDNKKSWFAFLRAGERSWFFVKATDASPEKSHFKYLDENFTLTLYDKCIRSCHSPFRFSYDRKCYFGITSSREHDREFFETLIRKITHFLSLCFGKKTVANRIFESEEQQCRWDYNPSEKESSDNGCLPCYISYGTIRDKFGDKLTKWLDVCERYETIIDSFFHDENKLFSHRNALKVITREEKGIMKEIFLKRLSRLEAYGNMLTKGHNTSKDVETAVSAVDKEALSNIIGEFRPSHARLSSNGKFQLYSYNFGKTPEDKKKDFVKIVIDFRSYFVHPFCGGKEKTPFSERIEKFFTTAGCGSLENFKEVTCWLSQHLSVILHCVLLQSKSVRENKGVTKPSKNLFPETNHTRGDYGKIILKYLQKCLAYEETAEKISKALEGIKSILLYSREDSARKTPCEKIFGSRSTDVVPTEEQLRCLSEVLTELTWRCEKNIKEAFEKNEEAFGKDKQQQNIWASQPICEFITHDFCENRLPEKRQNLGELIMNLKNSFNPDVNSVFCEQFTDYRESEVDFEALSFLADCLSDILHQLLLQEAGLTEFFEKKRMHRVPCRINV